MKIMNVKTFIDRPLLSIVISVFIVALGAIAIKKSALHAGVKTEIHKNPHPEDEFPRAHLVYVTQTTYPSVYAIVAGQINEKEVNIVYSTDKLVICSPRHDDGNYLSLYDTIVIEERGLYNGKLLK